MTVRVKAANAVEVSKRHVRNCVAGELELSLSETAHTAPGQSKAQSDLARLILQRYIHGCFRVEEEVGFCEFVPVSF